MLAIRKLFILYWWRRRRMLNNKWKRKKRIWVRPIFLQESREKFGAGSNLIAEMRLVDQLKYKNFFRMGPEAFQELVALVGPEIKKSDLGRQPISVAIRLGVTLRFLASGDSMASLSYLFRIGISTISEIVSETTKVIWKKLQPLYVAPPDERIWQENANGFQHTWNFPNCIGAIDGKHVTIQAPPHSGSEFFNYKGNHSVVLLAIADDKYTFSVVDIGAQGRQSDGGVLRNSEFGKMLLRGELRIPSATEIYEDGPILPHIIVGDEAFPLLNNLIKPYAARGGLNLDKNIYNYRLSRARRVVENAFGILNARWRIYGKPMTGKLESIDNIIKATICLHNFIMRKHKNESYINARLIDREENGITIPGSWRNYATQFQPIGRVGANTYTTTAKEIRDAFCRFFNEEGAVSWQWDHIM